MSKNTIAVLFEKKLVSYCSFVFVPINYIEGEERNGVFISDTEQVYENIKNTPALFTSEQYLYGYASNIETLKRQFDAKTKKEALTKYIDSFRENIIFGNVNKDDTVSIINIDPDCFEQEIKNSNKIKNDSNHNGVNRSDEIIKEKIDSANYLEAMKLLKEKIGEPVESKSVKSPSIIVPSQKIDVKHLIESVNKNVIAQEEAVDIIATTIAANYMTSNSRNHSNILVTGPTGCGKTEIITSIAKEIEIPYVVTGMESITQEGYVGRSVDTLLAKVYQAANGDIKLAQRGVLALDEIDKKASKKNDDVAGRAVLNSLLKILDGNVIDVNIGTSQAPKYITFDTSHLTIISIGAFAGLEEKYSKPIGFGNNNSNEAKTTNMDLFFDYGIPEEYMGRQGVIVTLRALGFDNYLKILYKSCNSPLKIKKEFLSEFGVLLKTDKSFLNEVARKTVNLKAGARGLKKTINESLQPAITEILKEGKYKELIVSGETVNNPKQYILR